MNIRSIRSLGIGIATAALFAGLPLVSSAQTAANLSITSITPGSGPIGTSVTINGSDFTPDAVVKFGAGIISDGLISNGTTGLTFTVPSDLGAGCPRGVECPDAMVGIVAPGIYNVSVTEANGTSNAVQFTVTSGQTTSSSPVITSVAPSSGPSGTTVVIYGNGFGSSNNIRFGGGGFYDIAPATPAFNCPNNADCATLGSQSLTFTVPSSIGAYCPPGQATACPMYEGLVTSGAYNVSVVNNDNGLESNQMQFMVTGGSINPVQPQVCSWSRSLSLGISGSDVSCLQQWLSQNPTLYPQALVTGYFGPLTLAAVERYQVQAGIVAQGQAGYGVFGPRTRASVEAQGQ